MSSPSNPEQFFGKDHASEYDRRFEKTAPLRDALHLFVSAIFAELPAKARILCVGAGTGAEILKLAASFPGWHFVAVEPSKPMLDLCRSKAEAAGIASRCEFHEGYLDSLPSGEAFDAATSLLVSHFILERTSRMQYFQGIAQHLRPGGLLASADLCADLASAVYQEDLEIWMALMQQAGQTAEQVQNLRTAYGSAVSLIPPEALRELIAEAGFQPPVQFLQTGLIHAFRTRKQE